MAGGGGDAVPGSPQLFLRRMGESRRRLDPEDDSYEQAFRYRSCSSDEIVDLLWRDGRVPEWVDLRAIDLVGEDVVIEARCCGRFTADDSTLYHQHGGMAPFNPQGPGGAFGNALRFECWDADDMGRLGAVAERSTHSSSPPMRSTPMACAPYPRCLGSLKCATSAAPESATRWNRGPDSPPSSEPPSRSPVGATRRSWGRPCLARCTHLTLNELPEGPWGSGVLRHSVPALGHLSVATANSLWLDGELPAALKYLSLWATRLLGQPRLPATMDFLSFHVTEAEDPGAAAALASLGTVRGADFQDTPLTEDEARALPGRLGLEYLRITNCGVSQDVVHAIAQAHPELNMFPRPS